MMKLSLTKLAVAVGALTVSLTAGTGLASADPNYDSMVNSPCTYDQAQAALHAENPTAAQYLDQSPPNQEFLRVFLSSPREKRISLLNQVKNYPGVDQVFPIFKQMLISCVNY